MVTILVLWYTILSAEHTGVSIPFDLKHSTRPRVRATTRTSECTNVQTRQPRRRRNHLHLARRTRPQERPRLPRRRCHPSPWRHRRRVRAARSRQRSRRLPGRRRQSPSASTWSVSARWCRARRGCARCARAPCRRRPSRTTTGSLARRGYRTAPVRSPKRGCSLPRLSPCLVSDARDPSPLLLFFLEENIYVIQ